MCIVFYVRTYRNVYNNTSIRMLRGTKCFPGTRASLYFVFVFGYIIGRCSGYVCVFFFLIIMIFRFFSLCLAMILFMLKISFHTVIRYNIIYRFIDLRIHFYFQI